MAGFKVPQKQRQVAPTALPSARQISPAGPGDFGELEAGVVGRIGGQVERLGRTALAVEEREERLAAAAQAKDLKIKADFKNERDKLFAQDAVIKYQDWWRKQEPVYTTKTGLEADGVGDVANKDIEDFTKKLLDKAENDEQREKILAKLAGERDSGLNIVYGHQANQIKLTKELQTDAIIANSIEGAAGSVGKINEEGTIFRMTLNLEDAISEKVRGLPKESAKNVSNTYWSSFHESILNRKVALDAVSAKEYYDKHKEAILPDNREGIEKVLKIEDTLQFAQQKTDEIFLTEDDPVNRLKRAREVEDPEKRKETESQVKVRNKELDQLDKEAQEEAYLDTLTKIMDVAKNEEEGLGFAKRLDNPEDQIKAEKVARERFNRKKQDKVTDRAVQAKVYEMIDSKEINNVRQLIEFYPDLSDADYNRFITEIRNKQSPDAKTGFVQYGTAKTAYETVKSEKYDVEDEDMTKEFMFVQGKLDQHAQILERNLTPDEANKFAAKYIVEGESIGTGFFGGDPNLPFWEASRQGVLDVWVPRVNDDDIDGGQEKRDIAEALAAKGIITDNDEVFRLYKKEAIMNLPLSTKETKLLNSLINQIGIKGQ